MAPLVFVRYERLPRNELDFEEISEEFHRESNREFHRIGGEFVMDFSG